MEAAVEAILKKPHVIRNNPQVFEALKACPEVVILSKLLENGGACDIGTDPIPGIVLNYDRVDSAKNYKDQNEYSNIIQDVQIPGNAPVSQLLHNNNGSRVIVPYSNFGNSPDVIEKHIDYIKKSIIRVCQNLGHPIIESNILVNSDPKGNFVLQIANKHVKNLKNNQEFTDLVKKDIEKNYNDRALCAAIMDGYEIFKYNEHFQKYPLLKDVPEHAYAILNQLISDPHTQPIIININYNINGDHNLINSLNTTNSNNTLNSNNVTTNNTTIMITTGSLTDAMTQFISYIKDHKPVWYKENTWMHLDKVREQFDIMSGQQHKNCIKRFNKHMKTTIGKRSGYKMIDNHNRVAILLRKFNELEQ